MKLCWYASAALLHTMLCAALIWCLWALLTWAFPHNMPLHAAPAANLPMNYNAPEHTEAR